MAAAVSLERLEEAEVFAECWAEAPCALLFPKALLTRMGVSYFTSENVFAPEVVVIFVLRNKMFI
jgi:hypothetical protein